MVTHGMAHLVASDARRPAAPEAGPFLCRRNLVLAGGKWRKASGGTSGSYCRASRWKSPEYRLAKRVQVPDYLWGKITKEEQKGFWHHLSPDAVVFFQEQIEVSHAFSI